MAVTLGLAIVMRRSEHNDDLRSTATLLRGALDRVERHLGNSISNEQQGSSIGSNSTSSAVNLQPRNELRRVFSPYQPDVGVRTTANGMFSRKGKGSKRSPYSKESSQTSQPWKKETICLRFKNQLKKPDTKEKIALAEQGLGLKELLFNWEGDARHIHSVLIKSYPVLNTCGGYSMMRLATNSTDLLPIGAPKDGVTVKYLKDILKSAKLYIRPL